MTPYRKLRLQYVRLLRNSHQPDKTARGFAIGLWIEFITLPTLGIAFLFLYPLCKLLRGNFATALIGFIIGKFMIPIFFAINLKIGNIVLGKGVPEHQNVESPHMSIPYLLSFVKAKGLEFFIGSVIDGTIIAVISYFVVHGGLVIYRKQKEKRRMKKSLENHTA